MTLPRVLLRGRRAEPGGAFIPDDDEIHHLRDVLRLRSGDPVALVLESGTAMLARVRGGPGFELDVEEGEADARAVRQGVPIVLVMALLKADRTELAIQKATEAGVAEVRVAACRRSVPKVSSGDAGKRLQRLQRVACEAAIQCGRASPPAVTLHRDLAAALECLPPARCFRMDEAPGALSLASQLAAGGRGEVAGVVVAVGPEGSFAEDEVLALEQAGFAPAGLGPRVLRAETAAIAAVVVAQAVVGDLG